MRTCGVHMYARNAREENKRKKGEVEEKLINLLTEDTGTVKQPVAREGPLECGCKGASIRQGHIHLW